MKYAAYFLAVCLGLLLACLAAAVIRTLLLKRKKK